MAHRPADPLADYRAPASWRGVAAHTDRTGGVECVVVSDAHRGGWLLDSHMIHIRRH